MLISNYIINLYNKGYSREYIAKHVFNYNRHLRNVLSEDNSLEFVECIIVDYITIPSL